MSFFFLIFSSLAKSSVLFLSTSYSILSIPFSYFPLIAIALPPDSAQPPPRSWGDLVILCFILVSESSASDAGELVAYSVSSSAWTLCRAPFGFEMWPSSRYGVSWFISQHPTPPPVLPSQSPRCLRPPAVEVMSMVYEVEESVCSSHIELLTGGKVTSRQTALTCRSHHGVLRLKTYRTWKWTVSVKMYFVSDLRWKVW